MRLLIATHVVLGVWALIGFAEWLLPAVPWPALSNPLFPRHILLLQWSLTLAAAAVFLGGYALRWRSMPVALTCVYAGMAALCAVETFIYMTGRLRFVAMVAEYAAYAIILIFLFRRAPPAPRIAATMA